MLVIHRVNRTTTKYAIGHIIDWVAVQSMARCNRSTWSFNDAKGFRVSAFACCARVLYGQLHNHESANRRMRALASPGEHHVDRRAQSRRLSLQPGDSLSTPQAAAVRAIRSADNSVADSAASPHARGVTV